MGYGYGVANTSRAEGGGKAIQQSTRPSQDHMEGSNPSHCCHHVFRPRFWVSCYQLSEQVRTMPDGPAQLHTLTVDSECPSESESIHPVPPDRRHLGVCVCGLPVDISLRQAHGPRPTKLRGRPGQAYGVRCRPSQACAEDSQRAMSA